MQGVQGPGVRVGWSEVSSPADSHREIGVKGAYRAYMGARGLSKGAYMGAGEDIVGMKGAT